MDWENERYVRMYVRDTPDLLASGWEGRAVLWELMRKVDRAGVVDFDGDTDMLAELLRMPSDVVERGLARLIKRNVVEQGSSALVIRNFMEAQEAKQSDAQRQRESRAQRQAKARTGRSTETRGSIYVARAGDGPIKIGFAVDIESRLRNLRTARPDGVTLLGSKTDVTARDEQTLLRLLARYRIEGEWFRACDGLFRELGNYGVDVTARDEQVTECHDWSQPVTGCHPSLAEPSLAEPSLAENNHAEAEIPPAQYGRAGSPDHEPAAPAVARGHDLGSRRDRALEQLRAGYEAAGKSLAGDAWRTGDLLARRREIADALKNTLGHTPETPVPLEALELAISCSAALAAQQNQQRPGVGTRAFRSLWRSEKALRLAMGFSSVADAVSGAGPPQSAKRDIRVGRVEPASREEFEKLNDVEDF